MESPSWSFLALTGKQNLSEGLRTDSFGQYQSTTGPSSGNARIMGRRHVQGLVDAPAVDAQLLETRHLLPPLGREDREWGVWRALPYLRTISLLM